MCCCGGRGFRVRIEEWFVACRRVVRRRVLAARTLLGNGGKIRRPSTTSRS